MEASDDLHMKYFVLKPRGSDEYAKASRAAMFRYALFIRETNSVLARRLWDWAGQELIAAQYPEEDPPPRHWRPDGATELPAPPHREEGE